MEISFIGLSVGAAIWLLGAFLGSPLIIGLMVSVAFGSTSAVTLSALGGSSPLLYLVFEVVLVGCVLFDKRLLAGVADALGRNGVGWAVGALIVYSVLGAVIMPRLFAGATNAFVPVRALGVVEVALAPSSGNITQTGYFILGALAFLALSSRLARGEPLSTLRNGFLAWAAVNALSGILDLGAKVAGAGDVFMPIRTATFAFLTEVAEAGFWRINGLYPEASSYGGAALASLAFTFTYWAHSRSRRALLLAVLLLALLVLSTSSTAYAGLVVMMVPLAASLVGSLARGRLEPSAMVVFGCIILGITTFICVTLYDPKILDPIQHLLQTTVWDKSESESGRERAYWNQRSLQSLYDTFGLGIGFGSSRSSNWLIAVISQLGIVGAALQLALVLPFFRRPQRPLQSSPAYEAYVLHRSLCACVFAMLATAIISGGAADPGLLFFIALAGVLACQTSMQRSTIPVRFNPAVPGALATGPVYDAVGRPARSATVVRPLPGVVDIIRPRRTFRRPPRFDLASPSALKAVPAIETNRYAAPASPAVAGFGHRRTLPHSWRNRHGRDWQGDDAGQWLDAREADLQPVGHVHDAFGFALLEAIAVDVLCEAASETMARIAADPQHIGPSTDIEAVLRLWSPTMKPYSHIPMIGAGGIALREEGWTPKLSPIRVRLVLTRLLRLQAAGPRIPGDPTILDRRLISLKAGVAVPQDAYRRSDADCPRTVAPTADEFVRRFRPDRILFDALIDDTGRKVIIVRARELLAVKPADLGARDAPPADPGHLAVIAARPRHAIKVDAIRTSTMPRLFLPATPHVLLPTARFNLFGDSGARWLHEREANRYDSASLLQHWPQHH